MEMVVDINSDAFASMFFDVAWDSSLKRTKKSVDLALGWLDNILQQLPPNAKVSTLTRIRH